MEYLVILGVCLAVYYRSFKYGLVVDDVSNRVKPLRDKHKVWYHRIRRALNGERPVKSVGFDRFITVFIHTTVCMLIYKMLHSLPAALLFAVNVSNNQTSLWLNGKRYGINVMLCLLAYKFVPIGIIFWFLTPFFQASAASFPLVLALSTGNWAYVLIIPCIFIVGKGFLLKWAMDRHKKNLVPELAQFTPSKIIFMLKTIAFYFVRGIIPFAPSMYISYLDKAYMKASDTKKALKFDLLALFGASLMLLTGIRVLVQSYPVLWTSLVVDYNSSV